MDTGNLPNWKAADKVYSKAYRVLESLAAKGGAIPARGVRYDARGRAHYIIQGHVPSYLMTRLIEALDEGNEETIKGLLLMPEYSIA